MPAGFKVELAASEPQTMDPIAIDWDPAGRLWIVEMADTPSGVDNQGKPGGRVRVLKDADGDDRYEKSTLFADGLSFPTGLLTWKHGLFVTAAPDLLTGGGSSGSPKCVRIFRNGPGSVMKAISRMSPPHARHAKGNSSPTRGSSFAHAFA